LLIHLEWNRLRREIASAALAKFVSPIVTDEIPSRDRLHIVTRDDDRRPASSSRSGERGEDREESLVNGLWGSQDR
jgi:hypothetical protein